MNLIICLFFLLNPFGFAKSTPYLLTRYMAKEYCSCRFVVGQSPKVCKNENKTIKFIFWVSENKEDKKITVRSIGGKAVAEFKDSHQGCLLLKHQP